MNASSIDHYLSLEVSRIRDLSAQVGRGAYDNCDPELLKHLKEVAGELYTALGITHQVLAS